MQRLQEGGVILKFILQKYNAKMLIQFSRFWTGASGGFLWKR